MKFYNASTTGVYDDGEVLPQYTMFEAGVTGGVRAGGGPRVKVIDGRTGAERLKFFAFDPSFRGGVNLGIIDLTADGEPEILVGIGPGDA